MTEPVAYLNKYQDDSTNITRYKPENNYLSSTPLYTAEQLHPRVKMTQAEFDEFEMLYKSIKSSTIIGLLNTIRTNEQKNFGLLKLRLNKSGKDIEIVNLWAEYDPDNPEETIEIVQTEKWFVRSKKEDENGSYQFLFFVKKLNGYLPVEDELDNSGMKYFDTKEEAELWVNPLTEAVQLPVEGEE